MTYQPPNPKIVPALNPDQILRLARLFVEEDHARDSGSLFTYYRAAYALRTCEPSSTDDAVSMAAVHRSCERAFVVVDAILADGPEGDDPADPMGWLDGTNTMSLAEGEIVLREMVDAAPTGVIHIKPLLDEATIEMNAEELALALEACMPKDDPKRRIGSEYTASPSDDPEGSAESNRKFLSDDDKHGEE